MDIMLDLGRLRETLAGLDVSIKAFDNAAAVNNDLEQAVANPDGRDSLRHKVGEFESAWNRKRGKLTENLNGVRDQLDAIITGWSDWDTDTAAELSKNEVAQQGGSIAVAR